jgi:hypothetical protein
MRIINSGSMEGRACRAVEAGEMLAQPGPIDEAINAPQEVIRPDVILEPEHVEQALLHHQTLAHHGPIFR